MLTFAKQITGYFNLKVNQRLFRFILTKIKFTRGSRLDCIKTMEDRECSVLKTNFKRNINQINFHEALE